MDTSCDSSSLKPQIPQFFHGFLMKLMNTGTCFYRYVLLNCVHRSNANGEILVQGGFWRVHFLHSELYACKPGEMPAQYLSCCFDTGQL